MKNHYYLLLLMFVMAGISQPAVSQVVCWPTGDTVITIATCNALFYDSGGPDGNIATVDPNDTASPKFVSFVSSAGTHVKCEFTQFSMNGILQIYDGLYTDPNKRLIGQFCTSTLDASTLNMPPVLFSSHSLLTFVYKGAAGDVQKIGWAAEISCVGELVESVGGLTCPFITNCVDPIYSDMLDPATGAVVWDCDTPSVTITAGIVAQGCYTNDYTVQQIPFESQFFGFDEGTPIPANVDDSWLSAQVLPFTFAFFGKIYNTVYPGANGLISFDYQSSGMSSCAWSTTVPPASPPYSSVPYNYANCVYGVYEDIFPGHYQNGGAIRYGVLGCAPCRVFVFNYLDVGLYSCYSSGSNYYNTYQMVLYEGTNIIDIYVKHRASCTSWNGGRGVIGIQNKTSSQILTAPNRDFNDIWTADYEAWRFAPISPIEGELTWYVDTVDDNHVFSHDKVITISKPDVPLTKYFSVYTFYNATGEHFTLCDTTLVICPEIDSTGVADRNRDFEVWPNPTRDAVYVRMRDAELMPSAIEVLDLQGKPLFSVPAERTTCVDLSALPAGVYLLRAGAGKGGTVKIVKQ